MCIGHKAAFLLEKLKFELSDFKKWKIYPDNPKNPDEVKSAVNGKKYLNVIKRIKQLFLWSTEVQGIVKENLFTKDILVI